MSPSLFYELPYLGTQTISFGGRVFRTSGPRLTIADHRKEHRLGCAGKWRESGEYLQIAVRVAIIGRSANVTYFVHCHTEAVHVSPLAGHPLEHVFRGHPSCCTVLCIIPGPTDGSCMYLDFGESEIGQTRASIPVDQYIRLMTSINTLHVSFNHINSPP